MFVNVLDCNHTAGLVFVVIVFVGLIVVVGTAIGTTGTKAYIGDDCYNERVNTIPTTAPVHFMLLRFCVLCQV